MNPALTKNDRKGLWAILWRYLLFGLILLPLGMLFLLLVIALTFAPFGYALVLFLSGHPFWATLLAVTWAIALWFARPLFDRLFEGLEYAAM